MLQYLLRWLQSSNAAKSLSKEGVFKAEVPTSNGNIQLPLVICFGESDCESTLGLEHGRTPVFDAAHLLPCFIATRMTYVNSPMVWNVHVQLVVPGWCFTMLSADISANRALELLR